MSTTGVRKISLCAVLAVLWWTGCTVDEPVADSAGVRMTFLLQSPDALDGRITVQEAYLKLDHLNITGTSQSNRYADVSYTVDAEEPPYRLNNPDSSHIQFGIPRFTYNMVDLQLWLFRDNYELQYLETPGIEQEPAGDTNNQPPTDNGSTQGNTPPTPADPAGAGEDPTPQEETDPPAQEETDDDTSADDETPPTSDSDTPATDDEQDPGDDNDAPPQSGGDEEADNDDPQDDNGSEEPGGDNKDDDNSKGNKHDDKPKNDKGDKPKDDKPEKDKEKKDKPEKEKEKGKGKEKDRGEKDKDKGDGKKSDNDSNKLSTDENSKKDKDKDKDNGKDSGKNNKDKDKDKDKPGGKDNGNQKNDDKGGKHEGGKKGKDGRSTENESGLTPDLDHFFRHARPGLLVTARYETESRNITLIFVADGIEEFAIQATQSDSPVIHTGKENTAEVRFDPQEWFSGLTPDDIESAQTQTYQGQEVLFINKTHNARLYEALAPRLEPSTRLIFLTPEP